MTAEGKIEVKDIVDTYQLISTGERTTYAVINDKEIVELLPMLTSTLQSLVTNSSMAKDQITASFFANKINSFTNLIASIQKQMVRNAEVPAKKAIA